MIQIYTYLDTINDKCNQLIADNSIEDYRIYLKMNNTIVIYIIGSREKALPFFQVLNLKC